ncbi:MAG: hypothetical protein R2697_06520 [Ilumatobacteraceae bacterium]
MICPAWACARQQARHPGLIIDADAFDRNLADGRTHPGRPAASAREGPQVHGSRCGTTGGRPLVVHLSTTARGRRDGRAGVGDDLLLANETVDPARLQAAADLDVLVTVAVDSSETIRSAADNGIGRAWST